MKYFLLLIPLIVSACDTNLGATQTHYCFIVGGDCDGGQDAIDGGGALDNDAS